MVSTHSRLKAAGFQAFTRVFVVNVSTHSRLKAAGVGLNRLTLAVERFNTQPPEGGCPDYPDEIVDGEVSTHSRLKAAGFA